MQRLSREEPRPLPLALQYRNRGSDGRHGGDSAGWHPKRQKVRLACQECRDRKIRCDGNHPCSPCLRKKLTPDRCVYAVGPSSSESSESYVQMLERRVRELEATQSRNQQSYSPLNLSVEPVPGQITVRNHLKCNDHSPHATTRPGRHLGNVPLDSGQGSTGPSQPSLGSDFRVIPHANMNKLSIGARSNPSPTASAHSPAVLGSSSAMGFMTEVFQSLHGRDGIPNNHHSPANEYLTSEEDPAQPSLAWSGPSISSNQGFDFSAAQLVLPPRRVADTLLGYYWNGAYPLQPFICRRSFVSRYERLWSNNENLSESKSDNTDEKASIEHTFHCMINTIFALGCRFSSLAERDSASVPVDDNLQRTFFNRATALLTMDLMDVGSILLVQALLLMAHYLQCIYLSDRCWVVVGMAVRVAQTIALHLDVKGETQAEREERRKTWCLCILLDRVQSMTFGRPLMLPSAPLDPLPEVVDENYLSRDPSAEDGHQPSGINSEVAYFVSVLKLSNITAEILQSFYTTALNQIHLPYDDFTSLLRIGAKIMCWKEELPPFLQYSSIQADLNDKLFLRQANLLHHRFLHSRILLFRRAVVQLAVQSFTRDPRLRLTQLQQSIATECVNVCTSAAQELLEVIQPHIGTLLVPPAWFTVFLIYTSGIVLAIVFLTTSFYQPLDVTQRERLQTSWDQCLECLRAYQRLAVPFASKCLSHLSKMRKTGKNASIGHSNEHLELTAAQSAWQGSPTDASLNPSSWEAQAPASSSEAFLQDLWWPTDNIDGLLQESANYNYDYC